MAENAETLEGGRRGGGGSGAVSSSSSSEMFTEKRYLSVLQCMGQSIHMFCPQGLIIFWNRSAENLYGYSEAEALGRSVCDLIILSRDVGVAELIIHRCRTGESWTGQFPVRHKMGHILTVVATNTPFFDDDGTLVGVASVSCDYRPFKDTKISVSCDPPLQTMIASKFTNLACKVGNKVRSKMKTGERSDFWASDNGDGHHFDHASALSNSRECGITSGTSSPRGGSAGIPFGVFTSFVAGKSCVHVQGDIIDESEWKLGIPKILASKAEAWIGNKAKQWSGKGTDRYATESQSGRFGWPWKKGCSHPRSPVTSEIQISDDNWPGANKTFKSRSLFDSNSASSSSRCESVSSSPIKKLDVQTDSLDDEVLWEDLTVREQIGQGSCGTVYHGLWHGSDVAIKVFSKQEYSKEVISSFRQEVSLMKRLRHPNILLFMAREAVSSDRKPVLPAAEEHIETRLEKTTSYGYRHSRYSGARGMNYLHNCNPPIVHRDLKSSNLLVDKNWSVKVADFGLSRVKHETYFATKTGKGTPQWMAPEVIQNDRSNEKSDLYSFGVILWELATQKVPWEHLNPMQVIGAVGFRNERLDIPDDLDPRWSSLIESCWHSDPQSRPTFHDVLEKLKDMQRQNAVNLKASRGAAASAAVGHNGNLEHL